MNNKFLDLEVRRHNKIVRRGVGTIVAIWFINAAIGVALTAGLCYVVWHFVAKFW